MRLIFLVVFACVFIPAWTQGNLFFGHHMFNPSYFNPSFVGAEGIGSVSFHYRNQWTGYSSTFDGSGGAPQTQLVTLEVPVSGFAGLDGLGINASNDNLGFENNTQINFTISGAFQLGYSTLRVGLMPGVFVKSVNGNKLRPNDPNDPTLPGNQSQIKPDLGIGVSYFTPKGLEVGLAVLHTMEPTFDLNLQSLEYAQSRFMVINARKNYALTESLRLMPNVNVRSDFSTFTFDAGATLTFSKVFWTGLSYRLEEALIIYLGTNLLSERLKVGYSFDYVVHDQRAKQPTSHEIFIRYVLPDFIIGGRKSVKTPRFSY